MYLDIIKYKSNDSDMFVIPDHVHDDEIQQHDEYMHVLLSVAISTLIITYYM